MKQKILKNAAALATAAVLSAGAAQAATVDVSFDDLSSGAPVDLGSGFVADDLRIVNGNCLDGSCLALNVNETTTITRADDSVFSLDSFWFQLLGANSELTVAGSNGEEAVFDTDNFDNNNGGQPYDFASLFVDVTSVTFFNSSSRPGNIRIDDLALSFDDTVVAPVPLPASVMFLFSGLLGLGFMRSRAKA